MWEKEDSKGSPRVKGDQTLNCVNGEESCEYAQKDWKKVLILLNSMYIFCLFVGGLPLIITPIGMTRQIKPLMFSF